MSQKTHPYSFRLQKTKKRFECSWYSDYFYNDMSSNDLEIRSYIEGVLRSMCLSARQVEHSYEHLSLQNHYKRCLLFLFAVDAREMLYDRISRSRAQAQVMQVDDQPTEKTNQPQFLNWSQKQDSKFYQILRSFSKTLKSDKASADNRGWRSCVAQDKDPDAKRWLTISQPIEHQIRLYTHVDFAPSRSKLTIHQPRCRTVLHVRQNRYKNLDLYTPVGFETSRSRLNPDLLQASQEQAKLTQLGIPVKSGDQREAQVFWSSAFDSILHNRTFLYLSDSLVAGSTADIRLATRQSFSKGSIVWDYLHAQSDSHFSHFQTISSVQVLHSFTSVNLVINEIIYLLNRRSRLTNRQSTPLREISEFLVREAGKRDCVRGIRLSCSGRYGGGSKKAQKSKTQSFQWGESSLHSFSSDISFASSSAATPFGKVGVKLWLSWRMHARVG